MPSDAQAVLVIGESGGLGAALMLKLAQSGIAAEPATSLSDSETAAKLAQRRWSAVAVVTRDDVLARRLTLLSAHLRPDLSLWVTIFDRTITRELHHVVPAVHVISPAELVAVDLADHCVAAFGERPAGRRRGVRVVDGALRLLVRAGVGLLLVLAFEAIIGMIALHDGVVNAVYYSTRTVATVASTPGAQAAPAWYKLIS